MGRWLSVIRERAGRSWVDCSANSIELTGRKGYWLLQPMGRLVNLVPGTPVWVTRAKSGKAWGNPAEEGLLVTIIRGRGFSIGLGSPEGGPWLPAALAQGEGVPIPQECLLGEATVDVEKGGFWSERGGFYIPRSNFFRDYYLLDRNSEETREVIARILAGAARREVMRAAWPSTGEWAVTLAGWQRVVLPWVWEDVVLPCETYLMELRRRKPFGLPHLAEVVARAVSRAPFERMFLAGPVPGQILEEGLEGFRWGEGGTHRDRFIWFVAQHLPEVLED